MDLASVLFCIWCTAVRAKCNRKYMDGSGYKIHDTLRTGYPGTWYNAYKILGTWYGAYQIQGTWYKEYRVQGTWYMLYKVWYILPVWYGMLGIFLVSF